MPSITDRLRARGLLTRIVLPRQIEALLSALSVAGTAPAGLVEESTAIFAASAHPLFFDLSLNPPSPNIPFRLEFDGDPATGFRLWLRVAEVSPAKRLFTFTQGAAGAILKPAIRQASVDEEWLDPAPGQVVLKGAELAILVEGKAGAAATLRPAPTVGGVEGIVTLALDPPTVLLGETGFGLEIAGGVTLDESATAAAPGTTTPADSIAWRGIVISEAKIYLPRGVPFLGGHAVNAQIAIGESPIPGIDLLVTAEVPATATRPKIDVRIECHDPTATGLTGFIPTLVEAAITLPHNPHADVDGQTVSFLAGEPVIARARFSRAVTEPDPETRIRVGLESQGSNGILSVDAASGGAAAKAVVAAAALATAVVADGKVAKDGAGGGVTLFSLLGFAAGLQGLARFIEDRGSRFVLHSAELESEGAGLPVGGSVRFILDYTTAVMVREITLGPLGIKPTENRPLKIRLRGVALTIRPADPGLKKFELDFDHAEMEIEDPGGWEVTGLDSLFDILGTRSGRGSMWLEVDLRFKINLGPIKVSGATIRATLEDSGNISATIRGLDIGLAMPRVIEGNGAIVLIPDGFAAALAVQILPLNGLGAGTRILVAPPMVKLDLAVDLPGPIPIANTGLGLYGMGGLFCINGRPNFDEALDPILRQLKWDHSAVTAFVPDSGAFTFGIEVVVGTAPDLGFSFSAKGGFFLTVPDVSIRGALDGHIMSPRAKLLDRPDPDPVGVNFRGVLAVDAADGVTFALKGSYHVPVLLKVEVPIAARFPFRDPSDWFIYIGSDGYDDGKGRAMGPVRVDVLPDIMPVHADGYLMLRGAGLPNWPRGKGPSGADGFVLAFGFSFLTSVGFRPVAWAEVHASADIMLATRPLILAGFGEAGGSLNLGPFSIGLDAHLAFVIAAGQEPYFFAQLCGHIDLFFFDLEGCVEISIHSEPAFDLPPPAAHPLDRLEGDVVAGHLGLLIDDHYKTIATLATEPVAAPTVWPDTLIHFAFAVTPKLGASATGGQFPGAETYPEGVRPMPYGSDMLNYSWTLVSLVLVDVTGNPDGVGTLVAGPLAAAWQAGKSGDAGKVAEAPELVLLTPQRDLWLDRLADGGVSLPHDPIGSTSHICEGAAEPVIGWAVGANASAIADGFHLPPDAASLDPLQSRLEADAFPGYSLWPGVPLNCQTAQDLQPPFSFHPAKLGDFRPALSVEHLFTGFLDPGYIECPPGVDFMLKPARPTLQIWLSDVVVSLARLWVISNTRMTDTGFPLIVQDDRGTSGEWKVTNEEQQPDGWFVIRFEPITHGDVRTLYLAWAPRVQIGILGVGGITATADKAASARNAARAVEAAALADAAAATPAPPTAPANPLLRCLLKPDRLYRVDIDLQWEGNLYRQDDMGQKHLVKKIDTLQSTYRPAGAPPEGVSTLRKFFFRTAKIPGAGGGGAGPEPHLPPYLTKDWLSAIFVKQDLFDPQMLSRHLIGYEPAQSEVARFRQDPLCVHFGVAHAGGLADAYGYELILGLRRVDVPGNEGLPTDHAGVWKALSKPSALSNTDRRRHDVYSLSDCSLPKPGATLEVPANLAGQAWYEVYAKVRAKPNTHLADSGLPGVTFKTSRWFDPADMLRGIVVSPHGNGVPTGDVEIRALPAFDPRSVQGEDAAYQTALDALGLDGWPTADAPRTSVLWLRIPAGSGWQCAGLLIESPEPIHRTGRAEVQQLALSMGGVGASVFFSIQRWDRIGARLLFLTPTPFTPQPWPFLHEFLMPTLRLDMVDRAKPAGAGNISAAWTLPLVPAFARDE
jgi:hypothetical protein